MKCCFGAYKKKKKKSVYQLSTQSGVKLYKKKKKKIGGHRLNVMATFTYSKTKNFSTYKCWQSSSQR